MDKLKQVLKQGLKSFWLNLRMLLAIVLLLVFMFCTIVGCIMAYTGLDKPWGIIAGIAIGTVNTAISMTWLDYLPKIFK